MWIGITKDDLLKMLQNNKCKEIDSEYGYYTESMILTFNDNSRIKIISNLYQGFCQILIEREFKDRGDSLR